MLPRFVVCLSFCVASIVSHFSSAARAQIRDDWQVLRIFVPEEEVGALVPNDYNPVELEDLAGALSREAIRRSQLQSSPHIADALYIVRCSAENLASDQSRWSIKTPFSNASLKLEETSVALRNAGSTPADDKPLLPSLRFSTDGTATLSKILGDTNYWFGLSATPTDRSGKQAIYDLRLPVATMARMLISSPASINITSPDVIVTQVTNPRETLPENWPSLTIAEGQQWFLIHLSGKSRFRLITEVTDRKDAMDFQHFVRRTSLAYTASEKGLALSADFEAERLAATSSLRILLDRSLRLQAATVNGAAADYRLAAADENKSAFDILLNNVPGGNAKVRIEAVMDTDFPFDDLLPTIEIGRAFSWEGKTSLLAEDALVVDQFEFSKRIESAKPKLETTSIGKRWLADWIGIPPRFHASIGRATPTCEVESITRLTVQEDWIAATTNLRIICHSLSSNELRLQVGEGWFIDDLTIEKADFPINHQLPDGAAGDVVLNWDRLNSDMSVDLQLVAHLPRATDVEHLSLEAPRVVTVRGGSQKDHYAIEQSGRFQIQANPLLQRLELNEGELASWQAPLLSRSTPTQLFQGLGERVPPIVMNRSSGTYVAKVITVATPINGQLRATYTVAVLPTTGAIDSASCVLKIPSGVSPPTWRVTQEQSGEQIPVARAVVKASSEGPERDLQGKMRFDFQLPDATTNKFVLQCEMQLPIEGLAVINLPLITMPMATETWMILPRNFELPSTSLGVFALPSSVCCDSSEFAQTFEKEADSMVGYRYDPSVVTSVDLRPAAQKLDRGAWIWSDSTEHWLYNDGRVAHQTDLQIFAPESMTLVVKFPPGWVLNRILLDGIALVAAQPLDSQRVPIAIPQGRHVHLSVRAASQNGAPQWLTRVQLLKPTFSLASLDSSEIFWLQPGHISVNEMLGNADASVIGRLSPASWWQWLNPARTAPEPDNLDSQSWRKMPLRSPSAESSLVLRYFPGYSSATTNTAQENVERRGETSISEALVIDRSSLCAISVAIFLAGVALSFWLLGDRIHWWWLCLTSSIVAVMLVPSACVGVAQLTLLSLVGGALARLIRLVTSARTHQSGSGSHGSTIRRASASASLLLVVLCGGKVGSAQVPTLGTPTKKIPATYGVLIPLNAAGELSAKHVYAPRKLMNLLNNSDTQDREEQLPQILGAKYMLKLSGGTSLTPSYVQEFTAEFDLQFNSTEFALRLPFKVTQLQLLRGSVSGQGVFIGPRLQQSADTITYRPPETGRVRLRLQLIPTTKDTVDRTSIDIGIPRIASSVLEVIADDTLDVNIKSIGISKRLTASSLSAELGPTDQLQVDWPTRPQRTPMPNQAISQSDTWLHISEGYLMADCQIRINGARALPKQLHLVLDAAWEPVGTEWNDVKLISNEQSAVGNRRIYLVNRESVSERAVIRAMMVPRNDETVSTLAVPFFSLTEAAVTGRTLAISVAGRSRWKLNGNELWNRLNAAGTELEWDSGKPPMTELWRIPNGSLNGSLQRLSSDADATVDESCELQLLSTQTLLNYRATWSHSPDAKLLRLEVPFDAELSNVRVNGLEAEYLLSERAKRKFMLINLASIPADIRFLEIQMKLKAATVEAAPLPRIVLQEAVVSKSLYQVNCGAELICTLFDNENIEPGKRLQFTQPVVDPTSMLSTLTATVGAVDLANSYRESTHLPTMYQIRKRLPIKLAANAMALMRTEQGWRATVEVLLSAEQSSEFVFFDVPTTIRDLIESSGSPYRVASSGVAGRSTLCLIPRAAENGMSRALFNFRLPTLGSSQSLNIPDVFFLGETVSRPVLALPTKVDGQPVRWLRAGRRLPDDSLSKSGLTLESANFVYFEMGESQQRTSWRPSETESNPAEVLFAWAVIDQDSDGSTIGAVNYWIDPKNHLDIAIELPIAAQLIGIQTGSNGAVWYSEKPGSVRVLMQPNYMLVQLRVFLRWPSGADKGMSFETFRVQLPEIDAEGIKQFPIAVLSADKLVSVKSQHATTSAPKLLAGDRMDASHFSSLLATRWTGLLSKSQPVAADLNDDELASWIRNWMPEVIGLNRVQALGDIGITGDVAGETVGGFWKGYLEQILASKTDHRDIESLLGNEADALSALEQVNPHATSVLVSPGASAEWYLVDLQNENSSNDLEFLFAHDSKRPATAPLAIAAILTTTASGLMYLLFRRMYDRTNEVLSKHAWLYWAFLGALAWLFLPVFWPSIVIALSSLGMLTGQLLNTRRRQLAMRGGG